MFMRMHGGCRCCVVWITFQDPECMHQRRSLARLTIPCVSTAGSVLLLCFCVETRVQIAALCQGGNCQGAMCLVGHHRNALCLVGWLARPSVGGVYVCVCVCETRYHIRNFDITVCYDYDNRDWVLQTTTFNSEMQGAGVCIRSLQPTKTLLMSQWYQPGTLGWRTCNVGSNFCTSCSITLFLSPLTRIDWPNFTVCIRAPSKVT